MPLPLFSIEPVAVDQQTRRTLSCVSCGLFRGAKSPRMPPWGDFRKKLLTVGEGPGKTEDRVGRPWQGRTGRLLDRTLAELGVDLERDALSTNSVICRPQDERGDDRDPTPHELACCRHRYLVPVLEDRRPRVVLLLGGHACASVLGSLMSDVDDHITKWRGWRVPVPEWGAYVCPVFHPSFVARSDDKPEVDTIWRRDLRAALDLLDVQPPPPMDYLRERVTILRDEGEVVGALERANEAEFFSFDYETTSLRAVGHELVCISFCTSEEASYAFMWTGSRRVRRAFRSVLRNDRVGKISHNCKFESLWSYHHFGVENIRWHMDTMLAAHVLDNRPGLCGLKLQSFLNFGIRDYSASISSYLEASDKRDPNSENRIREFIGRFGEDECLIYCGLDSLITMMLANRQMGQLSA